MEQKGADIVSDIIRDFAAELMKRQAYEFALRLIAAGKLSLEEIAEMADLPLEEVRELAKKKTA